MKKILTLTLILVSVVVSGFCQSQSTITKGAPMAVADTSMTDFVALATPTLTLSNAAQKVGTLPANTVAIIITAENAINYGDSAVLTSTDGDFPKIADTESLEIKIWPGETEPNIYLINNATGTNSVARITAKVQR